MDVWIVRCQIVTFCCRRPLTVTFPTTTQDRSFFVVVVFTVAMTTFPSDHFIPNRALSLNLTKCLVVVFLSMCLNLNQTTPVAPSL